MTRALEEKERRKELANAVAHNVRPYLFDLGFERDLRPKEERSWRWRDGAFYRRRNNYVDELNIQWEKYGGPYFIINFWTTQPERMDVALRYMPRAVDGPMARIYPAKLLFAFGPAQAWYGREKSIGNTIDIARSRLKDLDQFVRTGSPTTHLDWRRGKFRGDASR